MRFLWFLLFLMCCFLHQPIGMAIFFFLWVFDIGGNNDPDR